MRCDKMGCTMCHNLVSHAYLCEEVNLYLCDACFGYVRSMTMFGKELVRADLFGLKCVDCYHMHERSIDYADAR